MRATKEGWVGGRGWIVGMIFVIVAASVGCKSSHPGIEVGNPPTTTTPVLGKLFVVTPIDGEEYYLLEIASAGTASLSQVSRSSGLVLEAVSTTVDDDGERFLTISTTFSNGRRVVIRIQVEEGTIRSLLIMTDGLLRDSSFEIREAGASSGELRANCGTGRGNLVSQFADAVCSTLNRCESSLACDSCRGALLGMSGLHDELGLSDEARYSGRTLQEIVEGVGAGTLTANRTAATRCLADLDAISCGNISTEISAVENFIPEGAGSCEGFFNVRGENREGVCGSGSTNAVLQFTDALCSALRRCEPTVTCDSCRTSVLGLRGGLHDELGLTPAASYQTLTLREVADRVEFGLLRDDPNALQQCLTDLGALACPAIRNTVFGVTSRVNYDNLERIVPAGSGSCRDLL